MTIFKISLNLLAAVLLSQSMNVFFAAVSHASALKSASRSTAEKAEQSMLTLKIPMKSAVFFDTPVAMVNDQAITLGDLNKELLGLHADLSDQKAASSKNVSTLLRRMINVRLLVEESKNMGLDELPLIRDRLTAFNEKTIRDIVRARRVEGMLPDEDRVEKLFSDMVTELKLKSLLFKEKKDADEALKKIRGGESFDNVAQQTLEQGTAKGGGKGKYFTINELSPVVSRTVSNTTAGETSPVIKVSSGFALFIAEDKRLAKNSAAKKIEAQKKILAQQRQEAWKTYFEELKEKYVDVKGWRFSRLDFDSDDVDLEKLLKDSRLIAEIKGEDPITVGQLTQIMKDKFYHGVERKTGRKKLNTHKEKILDEILYKKLFNMEGKHLGVDKSEEYLQRVEEFERSVLFGTFIEKVIAPDAKVKEEAIKVYYNKHLEDYSLPEMYRLQGLVFESLKEAEGALEKLRKGADFRWVSANAEGQLDTETEGLLNFKNVILSKSGLPKRVQDVVSGAKAGDYRLYKSSKNHHYVLSIEEVFPSKPKAYPEVSDSIAKKLFGKKINELVKEWAAKLENVYELKVYLADYTYKN